MSVKTFALLYPLQKPLTAETERIFIGAGRPPTQATRTRLLNTTVFTQGQHVVRVFQLDGELEDAVQHLMQLTVVHDLGNQLKGILSPEYDIASPEGLKKFFESQLMTLVGNS